MSHAHSSSPASSHALYFSPEQTFSQFPFHSRLFKAIARLRLVHPTLVQADAIPKVLAGKDVLVKARTGSGKTYCYLLPAIQQLLDLQETAGDSYQRATEVLILLPTRELCDQVTQTVQSLLHFATDVITHLSLPADLPKQQMYHALKEVPNILISTPTKLVQYLQDKQAGGVIDLSTLKLLVLDEADLLLSYGYESDLQQLRASLPKILQTVLLSATLSDEVEELKSVMLHHPVIVKMEENVSSSADRLSQLYLPCREADKYLVLYSFLKLKIIEGKVLIFVNDLNTSYRLKLFLSTFSIHTAILNHELPYNSRQHMLQEFNRGVYDFLIVMDEAMEFDDDAILKQEEKADKPIDIVVEESKEEDGEEEMEQQVKKEESDEEKAKQKKKLQSTLSASEQLDADLKLLDELEGAGASSTGAVKKERGERTKYNKSKFGKQASNMARGIDFMDVGTVVNFDMPLTVTNYIHRIGRTARAGKTGVALSLVSEKEEELLQAVMETQNEQQLRRGVFNPVPHLRALELNWKDVEGFRYRCDDMMRSVTAAAVREARLSEIKREILNSQKLKAHFEDNPHELNLLKHDSLLRPHKVQKHLSQVPTYLLPSHLQGTEELAAATSHAAGGGNKNKRRREKHERNAIIAKQQNAAAASKRGFAAARAKGLVTQAAKHSDPLKQVKQMAAAKQKQKQPAKKQRTEF